MTLIFDSFLNKCKEAAKNEEFFDLRRRLHLSLEEKNEVILRIKTIESQPIFKIA